MKDLAATQAERAKEEAAFQNRIKVLEDELSRERQAKTVVESERDILAERVRQLEEQAATKPAPAPVPVPVPVDIPPPEPDLKKVAVPAPEVKPEPAKPQKKVSWSSIFLLIVSEVFHFHFSQGKKTKLTIPYFPFFTLY